jgi:hypothetical protein
MSFQRHAADCPTCAEELQALTDLREVMRQMPVLAIAPLERQRLRASVLRQANERLMQTSRTRGASWAFAAATVVALCFVGFGVVRHVRGLAPASSTAAGVPLSPPQFEMSAIEGAEWTNQSEGPLARVVLAKGTSAVEVHRLSPGQRFLMVLPDGELEVHGTRFVVEVTGQRTKRVEVSEGVLSLRVRGEVERVLVAGERWTQPTEVASGEIPMPPPESTSPSPAAPAQLGPSAGIHHAQPGPAAKSPRATRSARPVHPSRPSSTTSSFASGHPSDGVVTDSATTNEPPAQPATQPTTQANAQPNAPASAEAPVASSAPLPSRRFAEAVSAFHQGAYAQAEERLAQFVRDFPDDPRAQDASFLRAVSRSRIGDAKGAAGLAREYVRSFPRGLRRTEAERLIRADPAR